MNQESEMQRRFGAKVMATQLAAAAEIQLFLIRVNEGVRLASLLAALGGKTVMTGPNWVVAEMAFSQAMALRGTRGVLIAGGVSMDSERISQLRKML